MTAIRKVPPKIRTAIEEIVRSLPELPPVIRYYDDFEDKIRTIKELDALSSVSLNLDGKKIRIDFGVFGHARTIFKHIFVNWIIRLNPRTVSANFLRLDAYTRAFGDESIIFFICASASEARAHWNTYMRANAPPDQAQAIRTMLHTLCNLAVGSWNPNCASVICTFGSLRRDKYRVVRTGDCFLPLDHQARIVDYLDEICARLARSVGAVESLELRDACILVISYQYAFRPGQIARIEVADVRVFETGSVHLAVIAAKQRDKKKRVRVTRRIKREWACLFVEFLKRRKSGEMPSNPIAPDRLLFSQTPTQISNIIIELAEVTTGDLWTPTDLRHTAAQRLVDAGVSHTALAEFLVHANCDTANVYFDTSPSQAQRVNNAMAISPIYANVAQIARTRTIDTEMLIRMPADHQIGGVPHGVPIAGIGGCDLGQSLCTKNPVLSCYTCRRFMPLMNSEIHEQVLEQLRPVVDEFAGASRNNEQSPAFIQLRSTLDGIRRVVEDIDAARNKQ